MLMIGLKIQYSILFTVLTLGLVSCGDSVDKVQPENQDMLPVENNDQIVELTSETNIDDIRNNPDLIQSYVDKIVEPYLSKFNEHKKNIETIQKNYLQDLEIDYAVSMDSNMSYDIISRYLTHSDSISDEEWNRILYTLNSSMDEDNNSKLDGEDSYDIDKDELRFFYNFTTDIFDKDHRDALLKDKLSPEELKICDSVLETQEAKEMIGRYAEEFYELSSLLYDSKSEMKTAYFTVFNIAQKNKDDANKNLTTLTNKFRTDISTKCAGKIKEFQDFCNKNVFWVTVSEHRKIPFKYTTNYTDLTAQCQQKGEKELAKLNERIDSFKTGKRVSNSDLDMDFNAGSWEKLSGEEKNIRYTRAVGDGSVADACTTKIFNHKVVKDGPLGSGASFLVKIFKLLEADDKGREVTLLKDLSQQYIEKKITLEQAKDDYYNRL